MANLKHFNPRTHEECDRSFGRLVSELIYFNPRTHEECDTGGYHVVIRRNAISIHALTRSATSSLRLSFF